MICIATFNHESTCRTRCHGADGGDPADRVIPDRDRNARRKRVAAALGQSRKPESADIAGWEMMA
jgi:hypothetical protein